jgi:hypothetical protein
MKTVFVTMQKYWVAWMNRLAIMTRPRLQMMVLVLLKTSAEFAAVMASLKALVTVTETYWTSAEFAAVTASLKALVTAKETNWTHWAFAEVLARRMPMKMAFAMTLNWLVAQTVLLATTMEMQLKTMGHVIFAHAAKHQAYQRATP